jgi:hypothetical protein
VDGFQPPRTEMDIPNHLIPQSKVEVMGKNAPRTFKSTNPEIQSLYEAIQIEGLSGLDTKLLEEMVRDVERLDDEINSPRAIKPEIRAQMISRRVSALKSTGERLDSLRRNSLHQNNRELIARIVILVKASMTENDMPKESIDVVVTTLINKIVEEEEINKKKAREAKQK